MNAAPPPIRPLPPAPLTVADYIAFCRMRPRGEDSALIDGEMRVMVRPSPVHQAIAQNLAALLNTAFEAQKLPYWAGLDLAVAVEGESPTILGPDVAVIDYPPGEEPVTSRLHLAAEVLSPANPEAEIDRTCERHARQPCIRGVPVFASGTVRVDNATPETGFRRTRLTALDARMSVTAFGLDTPLRHICKGTALAPR